MARSPFQRLCPGLKRPACQSVAGPSRGVQPVSRATRAKVTRRRPVRAGSRGRERNGHAHPCPAWPRQLREHRPVLMPQDAGRAGGRGTLPKSRPSVEPRARPPVAPTIDRPSATA